MSEFPAVRPPQELDFKQRSFNETGAKIGELIIPHLPLLSATLPSFHRVQRCFGPIESSKSESVMGNAAFDLTSYCGYGRDPSEPANLTFSLMAKIEIILLEAYLHNSVLKDFYPESRQEMIYEAITKALWRSWRPWLDPEPIDYLLKRVQSGIKFTRYSQAENPEIRLPDDIIADNKFGKNGFLPSAEEEVMTNELSREFRSLVVNYPHLQAWVNGYSKSELAASTGQSQKQTQDIVTGELLQVCKRGKAQFQWNYNNVQEVITAARINGNGSELNSELSPNEMWRVFGGLNLVQLMGIIETLPPLPRISLLRRLTYIGKPGQTIKAWCDENKITPFLYQRALREVFSIVHESRNDPPIPQKTIRQLADETEEAMINIVRNSLGISLPENNGAYRIISLIDQGADKAGTLTEKERSLLRIIEKTYQETGLFPTAAELAVSSGLTLVVVKRCVKNLRSYDPGKVRYATKSYVIEKRSRRQELLDWLNNKQSEENRLNTLHLSRLQLEVLRYATEIDGGYYLTEDEIVEKLKKDFPQAASEILTQTYTKILRTLDNPPYDMKKLAETAQIITFAEDGGINALEKTIILEILRRIENYEFLGYGALTEIVKKLGCGNKAVAKVFRMLLATQI